jgi:hypothetical protein
VCERRMHSEWVKFRNRLSCVCISDLDSCFSGGFDGRPSVFFRDSIIVIKYGWFIHLNCKLTESDEIVQFYFKRSSRIG